MSEFTRLECNQFRREKTRDVPLSGNGAYLEVFQPVAVTPQDKAAGL